MENNKIIVQVDKTVIKITGLRIKGLNVQELEEILRERLKSVVRIIGVTGSFIEMDVYGINEKDILEQKDGIIKAISFAEGITVTDLTEMDKVEKIKCVDINNIPEDTHGCKGERWL